MVTLILKSSGKIITVSDEAAARIMKNPVMKDLYKAMPSAEEPEEVTALKVKNALTNNQLPDTSEESEEEEAQ